MGGRPFPLKRGMQDLVDNFHKEIENGIGPEMLIEQKIGSSPNFLSVEAARIDPCLTHEQKLEASGSDSLSVFGLNVDGKKRWKLQLRKVNGKYFFIEETRNEMTVANGWKMGTPICIWGAPHGIFRDGKVRFLFTDRM